MILGGIAIGILGYAVRARSRRTSILLVLVGIAFGLFIGPSVMLEKAEVRPGGFRIYSGIWGITVQHKTQFADVRQFRLTSTTRVSRLGNRTRIYLAIDDANGELFRFPVNDGVKAEAARCILESAEAKGIPIQSYISNEKTD